MSRWQCIGEHLNCASATIANCIPSSSVADVAAVAVADVDLLFAAVVVVLLLMPTCNKTRHAGNVLTRR